MSRKRQATYDLNQNWDREEDPKEPDNFPAASEDDLKNRLIKKAKIIIASHTGKDSGDIGSITKNVFSGFCGFGKPEAGLKFSPFSKVSRTPAVSAATSSVVGSSTTTCVVPTFSFGNGSETTTTTAEKTESSNTRLSCGSSDATADLVSTEASSTTARKSSGLTEYHKNLSGLNQAVCEWITTHVEKNSVCILSPIFKDYEKYLIEIENEKKHFESDATNSVPTKEGEKPSSDMCSNNASTKSSVSSSITSDTAIKNIGFSFGPTTQGFSFGPTPQGFSFGLNPSASFSNTSFNSNQSRKCLCKEGMKFC